MRGPAATQATLQELAENVQNAGYSVLIYFAASYAIKTVKNSKSVNSSGN